MSRERKVTIRLSEQEYTSLTAQMEEEKSAAMTAAGSEIPSALRGVRKEDSVSAYIRKKCLASNRTEELKRIRLVLGRMETMLQQISIYLKRSSLTKQTEYCGTTFTELSREMRSLVEAIERMDGDGGNGTETH